MIRFVISIAAVLALLDGAAHTSAAADLPARKQPKSNAKAHQDAYKYQERVQERGILRALHNDYPEMPASYDTPRGRQAWSLRIHAMKSEDQKALQTIPVSMHEVMRAGTVERYRAVKLEFQADEDRFQANEARLRALYPTPAATEK
jgi:hypothetical protein